MALATRQYTIKAAYAEACSIGLAMAKTIRISLANKCQLLFGAAVVLILTAALSVAWVGMQTLINEGQEDQARRVADLWLNGNIELIGNIPSAKNTRSKEDNSDITLSIIEQEEFEKHTKADQFLHETVHLFSTPPFRNEQFRETHDTDSRTYYRYARAIRKSHRKTKDFSLNRPGTGVADPLEMILLIEIWPDQLQRHEILIQAYIVAAGLLAILLAICVFWFITTRLILSPVRVLRDTAEKISEGDTNIRADINTGDEFQQLSEMFNTMVSNLNANEQQLRQINKGLDLKLGELAEHNVALFEADKIKGEFLANVSHELRTPLHSMIGFAEILEETLKDRTGPVDEKRKRYIANIISSSRRLLDLINDLLDLAKIEAGRLEVQVGPLSIADAAEGLINLIKPQAQKAQIDLRLKLPKELPAVTTDAGKIQQIIFNFLANAVKFTPPGGLITLWAKVIGTEPTKKLRISVRDTGPGIPEDMQEKIFEKFTQLDSTVTREHGGTGLGLTISRDLAKLLQGRIELESKDGQGATFSLVIPLEYTSPSTPLMPKKPTLPGANI